MVLIPNLRGGHWKERKEKEKEKEKEMISAEGSVGIKIYHTGRIYGGQYHMDRQS